MMKKTNNDKTTKCKISNTENHSGTIAMSCDRDRTETEVRRKQVCLVCALRKQTLGHRGTWRPSNAPERS